MSRPGINERRCCQARHLQHGSLLPLGTWQCHALQCCPLRATNSKVWQLTSRACVAAAASKTAAGEVGSKKSNVRRYENGFEVHELSHSVVSHTSFKVEYKNYGSSGSSMFSRGVRMHVKKFLNF